MRTVVVQNPDKIGRIGRRDDHQFALRLFVAQSAKLSHRVGRGELLASHAGDEPSAADFAAGFEPPVDLRKLVPAGCSRLFGEQVAKNDAPPAKQLPGPLLDQIIRRRRIECRRAPAARETTVRSRRPCCGGARAPRGAASNAIAVEPPLLAGQVAADPAKPSAVTKPRETSSPSTSSIWAGEHLRLPHEIGGEHRPLGRQQFQHLAGRAREQLGLRFPRPARHEPLQIRSQKKRNGRDPRDGGHRTAVVGDLRRRKEPAPADVAGQAQLVEPLRLVARNPRRQQIPLPANGRRIDPLQQGDDVE